jgi:hypothetical protein
VVLLGCIALPFPWLAQGDAGDELLADDLRFAEKLADWRYFDLAREVVDEIKERRLDSDAEGLVIFTEASILLGASRSTSDQDDQLKWVSQSIEMLSDWALPGSTWVYHDKRPAALEALAAALQERGRQRARMAKDADPSRAETLNDLAEADFRQADDTYSILKREYTERADQAESNGEVDLAISLYAKASWQLYLKGKNGLYWADVSDDPEFRLEEAIGELIDYQWELTEETLGQYMALHYQGVALRKLGEIDEATTVQAEVIEKGEWYWTNVKGNPAAESLVADLFDLAWGEIAQIAVEQNNVAKAEATIQAMLDRHEKDARAYGRIGYQVLLDWAATLDDLGKQGGAAEIVKFVADGARSLPEGQRARDLLWIYVPSDGSEVVSPDVLIQAARGLYDKKEFGESAYFYLRATAGLLTDADKEEYEFTAWMGAGKSLKNAKRNLEAALAYEHALNAAVARSLEAPDKESAAIGMYNSFDRRYRETSDAFDKGMRDQASERLIQMDIARDLAFLKAKETFDEANLARPPQPALFAAARSEMEAVSPTADSFERSLVYIGRCLAGEDDITGALAKFDEMLARAQDASLDPTNKGTIDKRNAALAEALNYKAQLMLTESVGKPQEALDLLAGFEDVLASQDGFFESVKSMRVTAYCQLGQVDDADEAYAELFELSPDGGFTRVAVYELANALLAASEKAEAAGDADEWHALLSRAADAMWSYNQMSGFPSYVNLLGSAEWFARVDRHEMARTAYDKAIDLFAKPGKGITEAQLDLARIGLATMLNELHEFGLARPYWNDLVARNPRHAIIMRGAARGLGGWLEVGDDGRVIEIPGSGDFSDAFDLWLEIHRGTSARKYHRDWWESKLGAIYALYRQGTAQPMQIIEARKVLDNVMVNTPNYDEQTMKELDEEDRYDDILFKPLYKYLETRIPAR